MDERRLIENRRESEEVPGFPRAGHGRVGRPLGVPRITEEPERDGVMAHRGNQRIAPVFDRIADIPSPGVLGYPAHPALDFEEPPHIERGPERQEIRPQPILRRPAPTGQAFEPFRDGEDFAAPASTQLPMPARVENAQALRGTAHGPAQLEGPLVIPERLVRRRPMALAQCRPKRQAGFQLVTAPSITLRLQRHDRQRSLEVSDGLAIGESLPSDGRGVNQVVHGSIVVTTALEVDGEPGGDLEPPGPKGDLQSLADASMELLALAFGDLAVDDLSVQVVTEG